ncbi:hypothetical protein N9369_03165 [Candidatus Pelagibacter sp.]|nr:hypothetical protein [bacterium]MDB3939094.1 hypothetical protein [Candidatus Pelagibacter sp.]
MSLNSHIKKLCDDSLNELFSKEYWEKIDKRKKNKDNHEPLYSDLDARIAYIVHSITIRSGIILENLYFEAVKMCCPHLEVWGEKKFKISRHAMMMASDQDNKDILETECPYGEAVEIKNRAKTRQVDLLTYDKEKKLICSYEIKRGGGHHDSEKQEKILENLFAVRMLLKSYGQSRDLEVNKARSYIISHMNSELFSPDYRFFQINGNEVNEHFKSNVIGSLTEGYDYFNNTFKKRFNALKKLAN